MQDTSRRRFIGVTGAGAAAVALAPVAAHGVSRNSNAATEPVVAYIADPNGDELSIFVGEREVVLRDRDLVTTILNKAGQ